MFAYDRGASEASSHLATSGLAGALASLTAALDALAVVDFADEADRDVMDAVVTVEQLLARPTSVQFGLLAAVDRRDLHGLDGAVTLASWYRNRVHLDPADASRRAHAATRSSRFPLLGAALATGQITPAHVTAVTDAAVPTRIAAIAAHEPTLVQLARHAQPRDVKTAIRAIADHTDADGTATQPLATSGPDPRRELHLRPTIDGLHHISGLLDRIHAEALLTALDALDSPDPAHTPDHQRRSPAQRRADALATLAHQALETGHLPTVQGAKPHLLLTADLTDLLPAQLLADPATLAELLANASDPIALAALLRTHPGRDAAPGRPDPMDTRPNSARRDCAEPDQTGPDGTSPGSGPRLRWTGPLPPQRARDLALQAKVTAVLTLGPYRIVNVGRTHRTLPPWLRSAMEARDGHCRGPDCDRPATWTEAHHQHPYDDGGDTDLNATIPLCKAHHDLITTNRWRATLNPDTGTCTWTSRHGTTRTTHPPRRMLVGAS